MFSRHAAAEELSALKFLESSVKDLFVFLFLSALFFHSGDCAASETKGLTLAGLLAEVEVANPELAEARRRLRLLEADADISSAYPNPEVEIQKSVPGEEAFYEIKATQRMPVTRRFGTAKAAALAELEAAKKGLEALENFTFSAARKAWSGLRIAIERRRFEETNSRFSMDVLNKIEMRFQTGEAGNADLARAKVEAMRSSYRLQEADARISSAAAELNRLMGRRPELTVQVSESDEFALSPSGAQGGTLEAYTGQALSGRLEPQALLLQSRAAELSVKLEKNRRLPDPILGFIKGREDGTGYSRFFLGMELPLWYNNRGEIKKALARRDLLGYEQELLSLQIRYEVYCAWLELGLAAKRLSTARETVSLLNDLRRSASQDYLSGKTGLTVFYETNRVFLEENINYLDALNEYYEKNAQLDAAINRGEGK